MEGIGAYSSTSDDDENQETKLNRIGGTEIVKIGENIGKDTISDEKVDDKDVDGDEDENHKNRENEETTEDVPMSPDGEDPEQIESQADDSERLESRTATTDDEDQYSAPAEGQEDMETEVMPDSKNDESQDTIEEDEAHTQEETENVDDKSSQYEEAEKIFCSDGEEEPEDDEDKEEYFDAPIEKELEEVGHPEKVLDSETVEEDEEANKNATEAETVEEVASEGSINENVEENEDQKNEDEDIEEQKEEAEEQKEEETEEQQEDEEAVEREFEPEEAAKKENLEEPERKPIEDEEQFPVESITDEKDVPDLVDENTEDVPEEQDPDINKDVPDDGPAADGATSGDEEIQEMIEENLDEFDQNETMRSPEGDVNETMTSYSPNKSIQLQQVDEDRRRPPSPIPEDLEEPYTPPERSPGAIEQLPPQEQIQQPLSPSEHIQQPETPEDSNGPFETNSLSPKQNDNEQGELEGPKTPSEPSGSPRPQTPPLPGPKTPTEPRPMSTEPQLTSGDQSFESTTSEDNVPHFNMITENEYVSASKQRSSRDKKMVCGCEFIAEDPSTHCTDTCLNKVLMIECNSRCPCGDLCKNKKFQNADYAKCEPFYTGTKGWGLKAAQDIIPGDFIMEYCGEVVNQSHFKDRMEEYGTARTRHYYFMTISKDEIIDAHNKGNLSRFINHSCDPNCETQKWRVNGVLRIGFFAIKSIKKGAELCFDYQYQRFGDDVQTCYCGTDKCRGTLGEKLSELARDRPSPKPSDDKADKKPSEPKKKDNGSLELSLAKISNEQGGLSSPDNALQLSRLMVQTDTSEHRLLILKTIQATTDATALKRFLNYQGLNILWSWMVDVNDYPAILRADFKLDMIKVLKCLPISTKNAVEDSKTIKVLKKWVDNEQSSNSSQADSSEEGPPVTDEPETDADRGVVEAGQGLLNQWSLLKEVFKIPKKDKKQDNSNSKPRTVGPATFSLGSFLANYTDPAESPPSQPLPSRKMQLSDTDFELPMSFGSSKREYSSKDGSRDNKRRRDDGESRGDKRARSVENREPWRAPGNAPPATVPPGNREPWRGPGNAPPVTAAPDNKEPWRAPGNGNFMHGFTHESRQNFTHESRQKKPETKADDTRAESNIVDHSTAKDGKRENSKHEDNKNPKHDDDKGDESKRDDSSKRDSSKRDETRRDDSKREDGKREDSRRESSFRRDERGRGDRGRDDSYRGRDDRRRDDDRGRYDRRDGYGKRDYQSDYARDYPRSNYRSSRDEPRVGEKVDEFGRDIENKEPDTRKGSRERRDDSRDGKERSGRSRDRSKERERDKGRTSRFDKDYKATDKTSAAKTEKPHDQEAKPPKTRFDSPDEIKIPEAETPVVPAAFGPPPTLLPTPGAGPPPPGSVPRMPFPQFNPRNAGSFPRFAGSLPMFKPNYDSRSGGTLDQSQDRAPAPGMDPSGRQSLSQPPPHMRYRPPIAENRVQRPPYDYRPRPMGYGNTRPQYEQNWNNPSTRFQNRYPPHSDVQSQSNQPRYPGMPQHRMPQQGAPQHVMPHRMPQTNLPQHGMAAQPHGMAPQPRGMAPQPRGMAPQPRGMAPQPHSMAAQQHGMPAQPPRFPPVQTIQQDLFKQMSEHTQQAGLLVPPTMGAMGFSQNFQGMFGGSNVAAPPAMPPSVPSAKPPATAGLATSPNTYYGNTSPGTSPYKDSSASRHYTKSGHTGTQLSSIQLPKEPEVEKKPIVKAESTGKSDSKFEPEYKLPPHWRTAKDADGKTYFYHAITRETQWDPPTLEDTSSSARQQIETPASPTLPKKQQPTQHKKMKREHISDISPKQKAPDKAKATTSVADNMDAGTKRAVADFKSQLAKVVVNNLGRYNKVDCKAGRIMDSNDFKYIARKLTHGLTEKEMQRKTATELCVTDSLKQRVKLYITSYMSKFGPIYHRT